MGKIYTGSRVTRRNGTKARRQCPRCPNSRIARWKYATHQLRHLRDEARTAQRLVDAVRGTT